MAELASADNRQGFRRTAPRLRWEVLAVAGLLLVVGIVGGGFAAARAFSPEAATRAYFEALSRGDADAAVAGSLVDRTGTPTADGYFLDRAALAAALEIARPGYPGLSVGSAKTSGTTATVPVSYRDGEGVRQFTVRLQRDDSEKRLGFLPSWLVVNRPALLSVSLPAGASGFRLDGLPVARPGTLAVLPLKHQLAISGGKFLKAQSMTSDATASTSVQKILFPIQLSETGQKTAMAALSERFNSCAAATVARPAGCPQVSSVALAQDLHWLQVGDPASGAAVTSDSQGRPVAQGHYLMVLAYRLYGSTEVRHAALGGSYSAPLTISNGTITVGEISPSTTLVGLQRPAGATDDVARQAATAALSACVAATIVSPVDCPQSPFLPETSPKNVRWRLVGDPMGSASVSFDGDSSLIKVAGPFEMSLDYDGQIGGTSHSVNKHFEADFSWDGSKLNLITVHGGV